MPGSATRAEPSRDVIAALRARAAAHPQATDALLALLVWAGLTAAVRTDAGEEHGLWLAALCNLAPALPLVWRRQAPLRALAASLGGAVAVMLAVGATGGEAAAAVALATAVSREPVPARAVAAAVLTCVVVVAAALVALPEDAVVGVVNGLAACAVAIAVGVAARARRAEIAAVADRGTREAALAVADERARIAREVHDVVSHNVAVMVALADGVEQTIDRDPAQARAAAGQAATVGREAMTELRGLLGVLQPGPVDGAPAPGVGDLPALAERARLAGLDVRLHVDGAPEQTSPVVQLTVYRVVQEALTNVLRHADGATRVEVGVHHDTAAVAVEVVDDGRPGPAGSGTGRGILGMRERVTLHGAALDAGPAAGGGWRVATRLPL